MDQAAVIRHLSEMADLIEIVEGNTFEILAFRNAARSLKEWDGDLAKAVADGTVGSIDRIGKGIASTIVELVTTGRAVAHEEIRSQFPPHLPDLLTLSGIGPKKVKALWRDLGVDSLDALETAAAAGRVSTLKGFGKKTEERILASIARRRAPRELAPAVRKSTEARERPVATGRLRLGTSGYAHDEWRGSFYPEELPKADYLPFYAGRFSTVEINNSFYRFPSESALLSWAEQVDTDFLFAVKANRRISHTGRLKGVTEVTTSFADRCRALGDRLGCILVQLPPDLPRDDDRLETFLAGVDPTLRYAIEFRHASWFEDAVFERLAAYRVALVVHDDCPRVATTDFVYVRLRRTDYDAAALADWQSWFRGQVEAHRDVFAFLKHDKGGESPERLLAELGTLDSGRPVADSISAPARRRDQA